MTPLRALVSLLLLATARPATLPAGGVEPRSTRVLDIAILALGGNPGLLYLTATSGMAPWSRPEPTLASEPPPSKKASQLSHGVADGPVHFVEARRRLPADRKDDSA